MNHRAAKYKYKYFNNKKFMTPEFEAQDKILDSLRSKDNSEISETTTAKNDKNEKMLNEFKDIKLEDCEEPVKIASNLNDHDKEENNTIIENKAITEANASTEEAISKPVDHSHQTKDLIKEAKEIENIKVSTTVTNAEEPKINKNTIIDTDFDEFVENEVANSKSNVESEQKTKEIPSTIKPVDSAQKEKESSKGNQIFY